MAAVERELRQCPELLRQLAGILARRDSGVHTLAEIWRRNQIGVPTREELTLYLRGGLPPEQARYIEFRVQLKCRWTAANLRDLQAGQREADRRAASRRRKFFESSVRHLQE